MVLSFSLAQKNRKQLLECKGEVTVGSLFSSNTLWQGITQISLAITNLRVCCVVHLPWQYLLDIGRWLTTNKGWLSSN